VAPKKYSFMSFHLHSMHLRALHSRCDKWHQEEEKASSRRSFAPCARRIVTLGKGRKRLHVGVHGVPMWMPIRLPFKLFNFNLKIDPKSLIYNFKD